MIDAGDRLDGFSGMAEGVGDMFGFDIVPVFVVRVVVFADRRFRGGPVFLVAVEDAAQGLGAAEEFVGGSGMTDDFSLYCILLIREREVSMSDQRNLIRVMQRCSRTRVDSTTNRDLCVAEEEGD